MSNMEKKDKAVEPKKEKLYKVVIKKKAYTKDGALTVADNPHRVTLEVKKSLERLRII